MGLIDSAVEVATSFSGHLTRTRTDNWPSRSGAWGAKSNWTTNYSDKTFLQISSATSVGQRRRGAKGKRGGLDQGHGSCLQVIGLWEVTNQTTESWIIFLLIRKAVNPFCGFCCRNREDGSMRPPDRMNFWVFPNRGWPIALFWKLSGSFFLLQKYPKNAPRGNFWIKNALRGNSSVCNSSWHNAIAMINYFNILINLSSPNFNFHSAHVTKQISTLYCLNMINIIELKPIVFSSSTRDIYKSNLQWIQNLCILLTHSK